MWKLVGRMPRKGTFVVRFSRAADSFLPNLSPHPCLFILIDQSNSAFRFMQTRVKNEESHPVHSYFLPWDFLNLWQDTVLKVSALVLFLRTPSDFSMILLVQLFRACPCWLALVYILFLHPMYSKTTITMFRLVCSCHTTHLHLASLTPGSILLPTVNSARGLSFQYKDT